MSLRFLILFGGLPLLLPSYGQDIDSIFDDGTVANPGNNEVMIGPIINEIIDADSGTLFIISNDSNRDLDLVGVEYRIPGERFFRLQNQFVVNSVSDSILVPDLNDAGAMIGT